MALLLHRATQGHRVLGTACVRKTMGRPACTEMVAWGPYRFPLSLLRSIRRASFRMKGREQRRMVMMTRGREWESCWDGSWPPSTWGGECPRSTSMYASTSLSLASEHAKTAVPAVCTGSLLNTIWQLCGLLVLEPGYARMAQCLIAQAIRSMWVLVLVLCLTACSLCFRACAEVADPERHSRGEYWAPCPSFWSHCGRC